MLRATVKSIVRVWNLEDEGKFMTGKLSSSRRVREDNSYDNNLANKGIAKKGYVNTNWFNIRFANKAYNKIKKYNVADNTPITNLDCQIEREPYWSSEEECIKYPKDIRITVFDFDLYTPQQNQEYGDGMDRVPRVEVASQPQYTNTTHQTAPTNFSQGANAYNAQPMTIADMPSHTFEPYPGYNNAQMGQQAYQNQPSVQPSVAQNTVNAEDEVPF